MNLPFITSFLFITLSITGFSLHSMSFDTLLIQAGCAHYGGQQDQEVIITDHKCACVVYKKAVSALQKQLKEEKKRASNPPSHMNTVGRMDIVRRIDIGLKAIEFHCSEAAKIARIKQLTVRT